jgi:hypothetical protein
MEKFIPIKIGDKHLHHIRLFIKSLENRGLITPVKVKEISFTTMYGSDVVFIHKYYKLGNYNFKIAEWA